MLTGCKKVFFVVSLKGIVKGAFFNTMELIMTINIVEDIRSVTDLKKNTSGLIKQVHNTLRPVVLTVNGKAEAVLVDAGEYAKETDALALAKMLLKSEQDIADSRFRPAREFFKEFRSEKSI
jgi:prevent-host-death family protein